MLTPEQSQMVEDNILLATSMTWKYVYRTPYDFDELYSICCEAMVKAATTFSPDKKVKFTTYAYMAIKNTILHRLRDDKHYKHEYHIEDIFRRPTFANMPPVEDIIDRQRLIQKTVQTFQGTEREKAAVITFVRNPYLYQEEIAALVGTSQKTVSTAIAKLRRQLQEKMTG